MSSDGGEAVEIYAIIKEFKHADWKEFSKTHLCLAPGDIEDIEYENPRDLKEQKYQMWLKWKRRNGRSATVAMFQSLVDRFHGVGINQSQSDVTTPVDDVPNPLDSNGRNANAPGPTETTVKTITTPTDQNSGVVNTVDNQATPRTSSSQSAKAFGGDALNNNNKKKKVPHAVNPLPESGDNIASSSKKAQVTETSDLHGVAEAVVDGKNSPLLKRIFGSFRKKKKDAKRNNSSERGFFCSRVTKVYVEGTTLQKFNEHRKKSDDIYPITGVPKGRVLILNNTFKGEGGLATRHGSNMDVKNMKKLWKDLGCELHKNEPQCEKTADEMKALIREMTGVKKRYGFLVVVIMTHGTIDPKTKDQVFFGADEEKVRVKEVLEWFHNTNSKHLHDVPKLFIFQFCRGRDVDHGVATDSKGVVSESDDYHDSFEFQIREFLENRSSETVVTDGCANIVPSISDILIAYATHENHAALRDERDGSWFINAITNVFMRYAKDEHVADLLTKVHASMKAKTGVIVEKDKHGSEIRRNDCKAMSNHQTSFSKKLYLFPGHPAS